MSENSFDRGRRSALNALIASAAVATCSVRAAASCVKKIGKVVVVGAGYGGATAAKYLRLWSDGAIDVTLVDPEPAFISCPLSNLVLGGSRSLADITVSYQGLAKYGVERLRDTALEIDAERREVRFASGARLAFDRLVISPGVEFLFDEIAGLTPQAQQRVLHAWKAGPQTVALRQQLLDMRDGGTVVISMPLAPYRCPPGPYERACQIASYLKKTKPRSKLIVLDGNPEMVSKKELFTRVFAEDYAGVIDYRPANLVTELDLNNQTFVTEFGDRIKGDVLNLIPPQRAARIAHDAGLITANARWCEVNWQSTESIKVENIHVLGDATLAAAAMPKSGHMANQHGKTAAAAIVELMSGRSPALPVMANTCYSFIDEKSAVHVASVHQWDAVKNALEPVPGAGGISSQDRASWLLEGQYAANWAQTIWADMLN